MLTYLSFLVTVVMLNALIAIMSDTYDRVQVTRHERGYRQRARLLLEMMHSMPAHQLTDRTMFPEWVHAIVRTDTGGNVERSEEHLWTGRVSAIRDRVDAVSEEQRTRLEELKTRMDEMRQDMAAMLQVQRERIHMKKVSFKDESRQAHWSDEHRSASTANSDREYSSDGEGASATGPGLLLPGGVPSTRDRAPHTPARRRGKRDEATESTLASVESSTRAPPPKLPLSSRRTPAPTSGAPSAASTRRLSAWSHHLGAPGGWQARNESAT